MNIFGDQSEAIDTALKELADAVDAFAQGGKWEPLSSGSKEHARKVAKDVRQHVSMTQNQINNLALDFSRFND